MARNQISIGLAAATVVLAAGHARAQVFSGLGDLPGGRFSSGAYKVSRDGSTVVGYGTTDIGYQAVRWTLGGGMIGLGDFAGGLDESLAYSVSADGSVVVGSGSEESQPYTAFRWTQATGLVDLGDIDSDDTTSSYPNDVSDDGSVIAFWGGFNRIDGVFHSMACRWTQATGLVPLGLLPGGVRSFANAISADGNVLVGGATVPGGGYEAFRWTQATGMVSLGDFPGGLVQAYANDVSSDGSVVVGSGNNAEGDEAFRWTAATGLVSLGDLPGGVHASWAAGVSDDGNVIVGIANSTYDVDYGGDAFIWTPQRGMRYLKDAVTSDYCAPELEGWHLIAAWGISGDGRVITGEGINPQGDYEAYVVHLDSSACRADFNRDGIVNSQDFFEFLNAFFAGCP